MESGLLFRKIPEMFSEKFIEKGVKSLRPIELNKMTSAYSVQPSPPAHPEGISVHGLITQVEKDSVAKAQEAVGRIGKNKAIVRTKKSMECKMRW